MATNRDERSTPGSGRTTPQRSSGPGSSCLVAGPRRDALRSLDWILALLAMGASVVALRHAEATGYLRLGALILILSSRLHTSGLTAWNERVVGTLLVLLGLVAGGELPAEDT